MTKSTIVTLALASALILGSGAAAFAQGDSGALVDALVRKKILTAQEGEDIRADLIKENAATTAGKINLSNSITELKIYGDIRLREQYENIDPQFEPPRTAADGAIATDPTTGKPIYKKGSSGFGNPQQGVQQDRFRFRLRLNADFKFTEGFFGGVQLQTNSASDSGNQTYGASSAAGGQAFGNYGIYISRAFFGWQNSDWGLTIIGGKQANPFYTTDLVWDPDINPDGITESLAIHKLVVGCHSEQAGYSKDGYGKDAKSVVSTVQEELPWELTLNMGQLIYADNIEDAVGTDFNTDAWLFVEQAVASYKVTPDVKVTIAPGYMTYTNGNVTAASDSVPFVNSTGSNGLAHSVTRDLSIVTAPGDVSFKVCGIATKVLWDFAYNFRGTDRYNNELGGTHASFNSPAEPLLSTDPTGRHRAFHSGADDLAWLAGFALGTNKKAGDWSIFANFRQTGIASIDPNLNDSDFALSYLNTQGYKVGLAYNITDFCVAGVTWYDAWNLRKDLFGGEATPALNSSGKIVQDQNIANGNQIQVLQVDLSVKF